MILFGVFVGLAGLPGDPCLGLLSGGISVTISQTADLNFKNRFIGLKSRGCYDAPAMTILRLAHLDAESLVMDGKVRSLRDQFVTYHWSELLYNGLYFSPEREFVENSLVFSQRRVVGGHDFFFLIRVNDGYCHYARIPKPTANS